MEIVPIDGSYGVEARGCDLARATGDDGLLRSLVEALHAHRVLVVKGQSLDRDAYLAFGRRWGDPIPHVLAHLRMKGWPEIFEVGKHDRGATDPRERTQRRCLLAHGPVL